jgi:hypothetical protein
MRRFAAVFCLLILPLLARVAFAADSNPYVSTEPSEVSSLDFAANCQTKLDNKAYDCEVKSSFGSPFESCIQFLSPGSLSANFDLVVVGLGQQLGCSCNPTGSFKSPRFNGSPNAFDCVTPQDFFFGNEGFDFTGQVTGKKLTGRAASSLGDSFRFKCTMRSSAC